MKSYIPQHSVHSKAEGTERMDLIHKFLNIVLRLISLVLVPPFLVFKSLFFIVNWTFSGSENLAGKVVLITGASSGIGEHLAYEYAKKGACLALVARREDHLRAVADKARLLGCPDVINICADVSKVDDCRRFVDKTMNHFGRLDHLVNNAGVAPLCLFEDYTNITNHTSTMDINFWGSVYSTHFAIPHLRKSKGKIVVISSCAGWLPLPRLSIYSASKGALISFYETLRTELGSDVGITIVTPGLIESEITQPEFLTKSKLDIFPRESTEGCAKAILNSTCRRERYLTEPAWVRVMVLWKFFFPEVVEWCNRFVLITRSSQDQSWRQTQQASAQSLEFKANEDLERGGETDCFLD